jgi:hypothetical protein
LKGLVTHATGKKKEAIMLVKKGLRYDVKSPLSWDILSNIYRKDNFHFQGAKYSTLAHINLPVYVFFSPLLFLFLLSLTIQFIFLPQYLFICTNFKEKRTNYERPYFHAHAKQRI